MKRTPAKPNGTRAKARASTSVVHRPRVAARPRPAGSPAARAHSDPAVTEFLRALEHPLAREIEAVRKLILGVSPEIREAIKWNAPSFRTTEFFATFNLRATAEVQLVLHLGAKVRDDSTKGMRIPDPEGLLEWRAKDRCLLNLGKGRELRSKRAALERIVRAWIRHV